MRAPTGPSVHARLLDVNSGSWVAERAGMEDACLFLSSASKLVLPTRVALFLSSASKLVLPTRVAVL